MDYTDFTVLHSYWFTKTVLSVSSVPKKFHLIFNVIIVIAASTIVTIQKRTVIFDS